ANTHGKVVGSNMAGAGTLYDHLPFFYSDLFDLGYEAVGEVDSRLETIETWEEPNRKGTIAYVDGDRRPRGFLLWDTWGKVDAALLVQLKTVLDNADGQLARLTGRVTVFGRYLDSECDLLVNAALFAALGWYAERPVAAAVGFAAVTAVLSVNFNLERLARGATTSSDSSLLGRVYSVLYGWQDRAVERFVDRRTHGGDGGRYHDAFTVSVLA